MTHDGDGIESVKFTISDASGEIVHEKVKQNAGYCAFGGGEPDCNVYAPAEHDYRWPNGSAIVNYDHYNVDIVITSQQGQVSTWFWGFKVEVPGYVSPPQARITGIILQGSQYAVAFETFGYAPQLPGQHVHFFFNTVPFEQAGQPGSGPWKIYGGASPFTDYAATERPEGATQLCVLVARPDHSVAPHSGNCFKLP